MRRNNIFLSYRRDDSPGYVSRLEDELERKFGHGRVFRDATDIHGGARWKTVIEDNLKASAVLLLVIGPRWERIWNERKDDEINYVALELELARKLKVPIIPLTLDGTQLSRDIDLGDLRWVFENQMHDISDRQGRWAGDFSRLVRLLEGMDGIGAARSDAPAPPKPDAMSRMKWIGAGVAITLGVLIWLATEVTDTSVPADERSVVNDVEAGTTAIVPEPRRRNPPPEPQTVSTVPNIAGVWQSTDDDTIYYVEQFPDGRLVIASPDADGVGRFSAKMPGKFLVEMYGIGKGEFSVSTDGQKIMGYIVVDGQQDFDTLVRIE